MGTGRRRANDLLTSQGQHWSLLYGRHAAFKSLRLAHRRERELSCEYPCNGPSVHDPMCVEFRVDFGVVSIFTSCRFIETPRLLLSCVKNQLYCTL